MSPTTVQAYGRWRDARTVSVPGRADRLLVHLYDCNLASPEPLYIGRRVQILALAPSSYHTLLPTILDDNYDVYDPQIVGRIVGAVGWKEDGMLVYAVENERKLSDTSVELVVFTIPHPPGCPILPDEYDCPRAWMKKLLMGVRSRAGPLTSAVVRGVLGVGETPVAALQYPDPREDAPDVPVRAAEPVWRPWLL